MKTLRRVSLYISDLEMKWISSFVVQSDKLAIVLHLLLGPVGTVVMPTEHEVAHRPGAELSHTAPCCSLPQLLWDGLSSFHTWEHVTGYWFLSCCSFPKLLCTDPESSCGFTRALEASRPKEEACSMFKFLEFKHTDLGFATAGSPSVCLSFAFDMPIQISGH